MNYEFAEHRVRRAPPYRFLKVNDRGPTTVFRYHRPPKIPKKFQSNSYTEIAENSGEIKECNRLRWLNETEENSERTVLLISEWGTSYEATHRSKYEF